MAPVVTKLTPDQIANLDVWRDRWLGIGLSTQPADRAGAQAGVVAAYAVANLRAPAVFVWLRSPLEGLVGATALVEIHRRLPAGKRRSDQVGGQVGGQVGDQVGGQVWDQVGGQVRDQVGGQVWGQVGDQWETTCFGQHEAGWLSYIDYFRVVCGLACAERAAGLIKVAECCGWWWPYRGAVILTERPTRLCRDERNRLHSSDGAAILYPDGWGVYAWHGVRVPERVICQPQTLSAQEILAERNAEVRRVMIGRFGADRFVLESGARAIHQDNTGSLYRIELPGDEPLVLVHVTNATPEPDGSSRKFFLRVPPDMQRAREAVAWTFGMTEREYAPAAES